MEAIDHWKYVLDSFQQFILAYEVRVSQVNVFNEDRGQERIFRLPPARHTVSHSERGSMVACGILC